MIEIGSIRFRLAIQYPRSVVTSSPPGLARPAAHESLSYISVPRWIFLLTFVLVLHRAWPDLQRMKLLLLCAGVVGTEVGVFLVRLSPFTSWTRGSWSTSDCRHGPFSAPEHAS